MGRILFIRVSAATYNEEDVLKTWPNLCAFAWQDDTLPATDKGVIPLVLALGNRLLLVDDAGKDALQDNLHRLAQLHSKLEAALAERDVHGAHAITNKIEDTLDSLERNEYIFAWSKQA